MKKQHTITLERAHVLPCMEVVQTEFDPEHCMLPALHLEVAEFESLGQPITVGRTRCKAHGGIGTGAPPMKPEYGGYIFRAVEYMGLTCLRCGERTATIIDLRAMMGLTIDGRSQLWQLEPICQSCLQTSWTYGD